MADTSSPSLTREFALAILPIFFSVFLFAGMLETYKDDMSSRKDLVVDFYRPMREAQAECRATQNQLFLKYFAQAGTYKLMLNEFDHMASADPNTLTRDYEVLPRSLIEATTKMNNEASDFKAKSEVCTSSLYRKYEEVALATGTYDRFLDIESRRITAVNVLYAKRTDLANNAASKVKVESMIDTLRQSLSSDLDTPAARKDMDSKIHEMGDPAVDYFTRLAQNEQDIFKVDQDADTQLISLFAKEVSGRYKRGLLSALLQW